MSRAQIFEGKGAANTGFSWFKAEADVFVNGNLEAWGAVDVGLLLYAQATVEGAAAWTPICMDERLSGSRAAHEHQDQSRYGSWSALIHAGETFGIEYVTWKGSEDDARARVFATPVNAGSSGAAVSPAAAPADPPAGHKLPGA